MNIFPSTKKIFKKIEKLLKNKQKNRKTDWCYKSLKPSNKKDELKPIEGIFP